MPDTAIQVSRFHDGGFVLHRITGAFNGRCSAWYDAQGVLTDAERLNTVGTPYPVKRGGPLWQYLQTIGGPYSVRVALAPKTIPANAILHAPSSPPSKR